MPTQLFKNSIMKLKSLLSICVFAILFSCSETELKLNTNPTLDLNGQWKITTMEFSETLESSIKGITSTEKLENIGSNFTLTYTFNSTPNELTAAGFFDLEIINEWGKKEYSKDVKGIDGVYPPSSWKLEGNLLTLKTIDFTQEIEIKSFTKNTLELQYIYQRKTINTLNSDFSTKTSVYNLTLERV